MASRQLPVTGEALSDEDGDDEVEFATTTKPQSARKLFGGSDGSSILTSSALLLAASGAVAATEDLGQDDLEGAEELLALISSPMKRMKHHDNEEPFQSVPPPSNNGNSKNNKNGSSKNGKSSNNRVATAPSSPTPPAPAPAPPTTTTRHAPAASATAAAAAAAAAPRAASGTAKNLQEKTVPQQRRAAARANILASRRAQYRPISVSNPNSRPPKPTHLFIDPARITTRRQAKVAARAAKGPISRAALKERREQRKIISESSASDFYYYNTPFNPNESRKRRRAMRGSGSGEESVGSATDILTDYSAGISHSPKKTKKTMADAEAAVASVETGEEPASEPDAYADEYGDAYTDAYLDDGASLDMYAEMDEEEIEEMLRLEEEERLFFRRQHELQVALRQKLLSRFAAFEWLYAAVDEEWFKQNDFESCLTALNLRDMTLGTRRQWAHVRSIMGKPRRFSIAFVLEERQKLEQHRAQHREQSVSAANSSSQASSPSTTMRLVPIGARCLVYYPEQQRVFVGHVTAVHAEGVAASNGEVPVMYDIAPLVPDTGDSESGVEPKTSEGGANASATSSSAASSSRPPPLPASVTVPDVWIMPLGNQITGHVARRRKRGRPRQSQPEEDYQSNNGEAVDADAEPKTPKDSHANTDADGMDVDTKNEEESSGTARPRFPQPSALGTRRRAVFTPRKRTALTVTTPARAPQHPASGASLVRAHLQFGGAAGVGGDPRRVILDELITEADLQLGARVFALLDAKELLLQKLRAQNNSAQASSSVVTQTFQHQYAALVLQLDMLNAQLLPALEQLQQHRRRLLERSSASADHAAAPQGGGGGGWHTWHSEMSRSCHLHATVLLEYHFSNITSPTSTEQQQQNASPVVDTHTGPTTTTPIAQEDHVISAPPPPPRLLQTHHAKLTSAVGLLSHLMHCNNLPLSPEQAALAMDAAVTRMRPQYRSNARMFSEVQLLLRSLQVQLETSSTSSPSVR